jgi:hypothetical protein
MRIIAVCNENIPVRNRNIAMKDGNVEVGDRDRDERL